LSSNIFSGEGSVVTVNGGAFHKNRYATESEKEAWRSELVKNRRHQTEKLLSLQRKFKAAGISSHAPQCNTCNVKEPNDKKFPSVGAVRE
jgi:hypothetical protein